MWRYLPAIVVGRLVRFAARIRRPGGGSAIPGLVVNKIAPGFLKNTLASFSGKLAVVSGSNGKSTTTKMLVAIARAHGLNVFTNPSTANIAQGLTSAFIDAAGANARIECDVAILELDEAHGASLAPAFDANVAVFTNVQVDQIVRFHDPAMVRDMLAKIAGRASDGIVINADDESLRVIARDARVDVAQYGVSQELADLFPAGFGYAKAAQERLSTEDGIVISEVRDRTARLLIDGVAHEIILPSKGVHFALDAAAAIDGARLLLKDRFDLDVALRALSDMPPVFARGETVLVRGQQVEFILVKNPASFQLNIDALPAEGSLLLAYGLDLRDPSFFWTTRAARLDRVDVVTGMRAAELALQLSYEGVEIGLVESDVIAGVEAFLAAPAPRAGHKTVVFSAEAMRTTRAYLGLTAEESDE